MSQIAIGFSFSLFTALVVLIGDVAIKQAADHGHSALSRYVLFGVALYAISALLWFVAMRHITLAAAGVSFSMFSMLALVLIGALYFKEPLTVRDYIGIAFAVGAMLLLMHKA